MSRDVVLGTRPGPAQTDANQRGAAVAKAARELIDALPARRLVVVLIETQVGHPKVDGDLAVRERGAHFVEAVDVQPRRLVKAQAAERGETLPLVGRPTFAARLEIRSEGVREGR